MTIAILSFEVFWDTNQSHGGVDLALAGGELVRLTTDRPDVLTCWNELLNGPCPRYFSENDSSGICSLTYPLLRAVGGRKRTPEGSGRLFR